MDEAKMERVMEEFAQEAEGMDENDPRQMARMMRKLSETGLPLGEGMEEAIRRLEAGEDPEKIEAEMGDLLEEDGPPGRPAVGRRGPLEKPPEVDETLYDL